MAKKKIVTATDFSDEFVIRDNKISLAGQPIVFTGERKIAQLDRDIIIYSETSSGHWVMTDNAINSGWDSEKPLVAGDGGPFYTLQFANGSVAYDPINSPSGDISNIVFDLPQAGEYPVLQDPQLVFRRNYNPAEVAYNMYSNYLGGDFLKEYYKSGGKLYVLFTSSESPTTAHYLAHWSIDEYGNVTRTGNPDYTMGGSGDVYLKRDGQLAELFGRDVTVTFYFSTSEQLPELSDDGQVCIVELGDIGKVGIPVNKIEPLSRA